MSLRLVSGCRLVVLHWLLLLVFLLFLLAHELVGGSSAATAVGVLLILSSLFCAALALLGGFRERCSKCDARLADQLPKQPLVGVEGVLFDRRTKAIIFTAIEGRFRCEVCGNWC